MLAGTFTVSRIATMFPNSSFGEVRIILTMLCAFSVLMFRSKEPISNEAVRLASVLTGLCLFLGFHAAFFGAADFRVSYIVNLGHLIVMGWLAVALFRTTADTDALAWCLVAVAVMLLPAWFMKAPPFGAITLYRIEFLGFAGALYLAMTRSLWLYLLLPIFLFGTLASVSKAAVAFAIVAICYATFLLAVLRQPVVKFVVAMAVGIGLFFAISLPDFKPRFNKMVQPTTYARQLSNEITVNDASQRIRMAMQAYHMTKESLVWGTGIGIYHIELMNSEEDGYDIYRYPHNVTMEVAYSTGLAGLAVYLAALFVFMVSLHRRVLEYPPVAAIAAGAVFVVLTSHISGDFYDMRFFWLLLIPSWVSVVIAKKTPTIG
jgi:hypothetical protein